MSKQKKSAGRSLTIGTAILLAGVFLTVGCGDHWALPTGVENNVEDFGANDTSFVRLDPDWDASSGYTWENPGDIVIGDDGHIFVIDHAEVDGHTGGRIVELNGNGVMLQRDLFTGVTDTSEAPLGIGQDSKLNLYMVNGTDQVFVWNQYVAQIGIEMVMDSLQIINTETEEIFTFYGDRPIWQQYMNIPPGQWTNHEFFGSSDPDVIAALEAPYVFYTDSSYAVGSSVSPAFTDIAAGNDRSEQVFISDRVDDRIIQVNVQLNRIIVLSSGELAYTFVGEFEDAIIGTGQGQGSVNEPVSLVTQNAGGATAIYIAQTRGNFLVQRIKGSGSNWLYDITPAGGVPELQVLEYFGTPASVAVGEQDTRGLGLIYVADREQNRVTSFFNSGYRFREVAVEEELVDLEAGQLLDDILAQTGDALDEVLNPDLVDFAAARPWRVELDSAQTLSSYLLGEGVNYADLFEPEIPQNYVAGSDTVVNLAIAVDTTVAVFWPILDSPGGVATKEGVVYISDSGNNRLLRYIRTDANTYLPTDPNN